MMFFTMRNGLSRVSAFSALSLGLVGCAGDRLSLSNFGLQSDALALPSLAAQRQQIADGVTVVRQGVEGAYEVTVASAGGAVRRITGRVVSATDACLPEDSAQGCKPAAVSACRRAGFSDGAPMSSSSYSACRSGWSISAGDAPADACKTKRRINSALCW